MTNRDAVPARQAGNRFLGSLKGLKIRAQLSFPLVSRFPNMSVLSRPFNGRHVSWKGGGPVKRDRLQKEGGQVTDKRLTGYR